MAIERHSAKYAIDAVFANIHLQGRFVEPNSHYIIHPLLKPEDCGRVIGPLDHDRVVSAVADLTSYVRQTCRQELADKLLPVHVVYTKGMLDSSRDVRNF